MGVFVVEEDRWGYFVIVDTLRGTRAAYTKHRPRAEQIVQRLNEEPALAADETLRLPDDIDAPRRPEPVPVGQVRARGVAAGWSRHRRT